MISQSVVCIYMHVPCWAVVIYSRWLYIVLEHSRSPSTQVDYSSYRWFKSAACRHCVIGLLTSIVWTLIDRLDDVYITDIVYLLDVLVVIVYISYCNCWDYLLLHEDWGVFWGLGGVEFFNWKVGKKFFSKMFLGFWNACNFVFGGGILGCLGCPTPPSGGRAGSESNTLLPMTMICDRLKFWSGPAWRSKVIIRKPWRRKKKKEQKKKKKLKNSDKTIRHSRREAGNA